MDPSTSSRAPDCGSVRLELRLPAAFRELARCSLAVRGFLSDHGVEAGVRYRVDLALEEMLSNIIRHSGARAPIAVDCVVAGNAVTVRLEDDGRAFDPTAASAPEIPASPAEARVGGYGIHMVRRSVDAMTYRRENGRNCLELRVTPQPGGAAGWKN